MTTSQKDTNIKIHLILAPESEIRVSGHEEITFQLTDQILTFNEIKPQIKECLFMLQTPGATMEELLDSAANSPVDDRARLVALLMQLSRSKVVRRTLTIDNIQLLSTYAISPHFRQLPASPDESYHLSRFAYLRRKGNELLIESPRAFAQAVIHNWRAAVLLSATDGKEYVPGLSQAKQQAFFMFLAQAGLAVINSEDNQTSEENDEVLRQWEFHDLLFHSRSRAGRQSNPIGGTYRFEGVLSQLPLLKPAMSAKIIPLAKPDMIALLENDRPFTQVLEQRRSIRTHVEKVINVIQLGEFLYRTCHIQEITTDVPRLGKRPYPSGGALHPLEIYLVVKRCKGLAPGFYRYCPYEHHLEQIDVREEYQAAFLRFAERAQGNKNRPSILFLYTARFQRVSWKYSSIAYSLILKEVGALQQTMYLVATAMDLAPCAIGSGDSDLFAKATGIRYEIESTVGEFALQ